MSVVLFFIGLAGVPDDVTTWGKWIAWVQPYVVNIAEYVNRDTVGYALMAVAVVALIGIHGGPYIFSYAQHRRARKEAEQGIESKKGFLDYLVDFPTAAKEIEKLFSGITRDTQNLNTRLPKHTAKFSKSSSPEEAKKHAARAANLIEKYSKNLERRSERLKLVERTFSESIVGTVEHSLNMNHWSKDEIVDLLTTAEILHKTVKTSETQLRGLRNAAIQVKDISKDMYRSISIFESVIDDYLISYKGLRRSTNLVYRRLKDAVSGN